MLSAVDPAALVSLAVNVLPTVVYSITVLFYCALLFAFSSVLFAVVVVSNHIDKFCEVMHTLGFAYPNGSARPSIGEIATFVKSLDANAKDMFITYRIVEEKAIFVKLKPKSSMHYARNN